MYDYKDDARKLIRDLLDPAFKNIAIISHIRPDADAIGSQVALALWLKSHGKNVVAHNDDQVPDNISWLTGFFPVANQDESALNSCDAIVFVDGNDPKRFGRHEAWFRESEQPKFMIDHHPQPSDIFRQTLSVTKAGSTAELIYLIIREHDLENLSPEMCRAIYTGIMTDTGSFRFDSVGPHTHEIIADVIKRGNINVSEIHQKVYDNRTLNQLSLLSRVLGTTELDERTQLATITVTETDLAETGSTHDDLEGFIAHPLSLRDCTVAVLFSERDGKVKMSLRSKADFDVNKLARFFDGGGHQKAAGAWHPGPLEKAVSEIKEKVRELSA